jgi:hypothetical protein
MPEKAILPVKTAFAVSSCNKLGKTLNVEEFFVVEAAMVVPDFSKIGLGT